MKVNIGCGANKLPGWRNFDINPKFGEVLDIATQPLPFAANSVDRILIEHVLEHVTGPQGYRFMQEAMRVLKVGGVLRICVPQLSHVLRLKGREKSEDLIVNHGHLMVYCQENLELMLYTAGFRIENIRTVSWLEGEDGHWKTIGRELDAIETLRFEATK